MRTIYKMPRLKFILMVDAVILTLLFWTAASSGMFYKFNDRCSAVELPLGLVSGMSESDFQSIIDTDGCNVEEKRESLREPCRITLYRCSSYLFQGKKYSVEFEFLCGRLMSVAINDDDDKSIGVGILGETQILRRRIGNMVRYSDAEMIKEVHRFLLDYL